MKNVDQGMVFCFIHGHCKRIVALLEPDVELGEYGANLDGKGEMEVMGHLRTLSLYTKKLEDYFSNLVVQDLGGSE